jgi:RNA polymerase primary sigma factor
MKYFSDEIQDTLNTITMTTDEVTDAAKKYKNSKNDRYKDKYKDQVVNGTMRLVYKTCSGYGFGPRDFNDAFQYGVIGVLEALDRFDPSLEMKFSTYAVYWIKHYLNLAKNEISTIKLPRDNHIAASKYEAIKGAAIISGMSEEKIARKMGVRKKKLNTIKRDHQLCASLRFLYSTDLPTTKSSDSEITVSRSILKDSSASHEETIANEDMIEKVKKIAEKHLKTKEYMVFKEKFLSEDGEIKANLDVAKNLEIPYSSINDILSRAIRKIRVKIKNGE